MVKARGIRVEKRTHDGRRKKQHGEERQYAVERQSGGKKEDVVLFQLSPDQLSVEVKILNLSDGDLRGADDEFYHQAAGVLLGTEVGIFQHEVLAPDAFKLHDSAG